MGSLIIGSVMVTVYSSGNERVVMRSIKVDETVKKERRWTMVEVSHSFGLSLATVREVDDS